MSRRTPDRGDNVLASADEVVAKGARSSGVLASLTGSCQRLPMKQREAEEDIAVMLLMRARMPRGGQEMRAAGAHGRGGGRCRQRTLGGVCQRGRRWQLMARGSQRTRSRTTEKEGRGRAEVSMERHASRRRKGDGVLGHAERRCGRLLVRHGGGGPTHGRCKGAVLGSDGRRWCGCEVEVEVGGALAW